MQVTTLVSIAVLVVGVVGGPFHYEATRPNEPINAPSTFLLSSPPQPPTLLVSEPQPQVSFSGPQSQFSTFSVSEPQVSFSGLQPQVSSFVSSQSQQQVPTSRVSESQPQVSTFSVLTSQPQVSTFRPSRSQSRAPMIFLSGLQPQASTLVAAQPQMPVFSVPESQSEEVPVLVTAQSQPQLPMFMFPEPQPQVPVFTSSRPQQQVPVFMPSPSLAPVTTAASQSQQLTRVVSLPPKPVVASIQPEVPTPVVVVADPSTSTSLTSGVQFQRICNPVSHPLVDDTLDDEVFHFSWLHDGGREYNWQEATNYCRGLGHGFQAVSLESSRKDAHMASILLAREYFYFRFPILTIVKSLNQ